LAADGTTTMLMSLGDILGVDGVEPYESIVRMRRMATPGHYFTCYAPTVVYRCPSGNTDTIGYLTVTMIRDDGLEMEEEHIMVATGQDDPLQIRRHTFSGIQMADALSVDLRVVIRFTAAYQSAIPASIDAVLVPIDKKEMYAT
jgi:hypothetical protein